MNAAARCATSPPGIIKHARLFDRCDATGGIEPFDKLVNQFMTVEPYSKARRVFVTVDNGSAHRGQASIRRVQDRYKNLILIHPSTRQLAQPSRDLLPDRPTQDLDTPNDFPDLDTLQRQLLAFGHRYEQIAQPFANGRSPAPTSSASPTSSSYLATQAA